MAWHVPLTLSKSVVATPQRCCLRSTQPVSPMQRQPRPVAWRATPPKKEACAGWPQTSHGPGRWTRPLETISSMRIMGPNRTQPPSAKSESLVCHRTNSIPPLRCLPLPPPVLATPKILPSPPNSGLHGTGLCAVAQPKRSHFLLWTCNPLPLFQRCSSTIGSSAPTPLLCCRGFPPSSWIF